MPVTIRIQFCDDSGAWHDFATILETDLDLTPGTEFVEYQIVRHHTTSELANLVDMTGIRLWQFNWLKAGQDGGLSVRRATKFERMAGDILILRTADIAKRLA